MVELLQASFSQIKSLQILTISIHLPPPSPPHNLDKSTTITIDDRTFTVEADDLEKICDLGHGAYGIVEKMRHRQTSTVMAVKRITVSVNTQEQVNTTKSTFNSRRFVLFPILFHNRNAFSPI